MNDTTPERLLLRPTEAAEVLGVGNSKIYELIAEGVIPTVQVGRRLRIPLEALRNWIRQETGKGGTHDVSEDAPKG